MIRAGTALPRIIAVNLSLPTTPPPWRFLSLLRPALRWLTVFAVAALTLAAQAQTDATVTKRTTELRETPGETARSLAQLSAQTAVTRLTERSGPWIQVQVRTDSAGAAPGAIGWVHMFDLGNPSASASGGNSATGVLRGITGFFNRGGSQQGSIVATSTIGIRGLGAEDLARSQPNLAAVDQMEALRLDADTARQFAASAPLASQTVTALPSPAPSQAPGGAMGQKEPSQ